MEAVRTGMTSRKHRRSLGVQRGSEVEDEEVNTFSTWMMATVLDVATERRQFFVGPVYQRRGLSSSQEPTAKPARRWYGKGFSYLPLDDLHVTGVDDIQKKATKQSDCAHVIPNGIERTKFMHGQALCTPSSPWPSVPSTPPSSRGGQ